MNFVWDGLRQLRHFNGYVLLLEEDHFVSPDALYILKMLIDNKERCEINNASFASSHVQSVLRLRCAVDRYLPEDLLSIPHQY